MSNNEVKNIMEAKEKKFDLEERLIDFAVLVLNGIDSLFNNRAGNHIAFDIQHSMFIIYS